ncbi:MAG: PAS domain S-box protein, partial [Myxococcales bacterium]
ACAAAFDASIHQGVTLNVEFRVVWPDGTVRWLRDQGDVFQDSGGVYMAGACVDVTERREAEEAVRESEERLRLIVRSATDYAIYTLTPDRIVTTWSPGAVATFGYAASEILGRSGDIVFTPEDRAHGAPEHEVDRARREGRAEDERWHLRKDGSRFYASGVTTPLGPHGSRGFVKVARDLTERKRMEDALREARDRLEEKVIERTTELQAEVAEHVRTEAARTALQRQLTMVQESERRRVARDLHDQTGQLLAGLALAIKAVGLSGPLPPAASERLEEVQRVADELGRQVHALAVRLRPTALDDLGLRAALNQLTTQWAVQSRVSIDLQTVGFESGRLPEEIETVVYRVVQEALTNVTKHAQATQVSVVVSRQGGHAMVMIEDDGRGFVPEAVGQGRLGLVGMRERVEQVGGHLDIESSLGRGTTLLVRLPVAPTPLPPPVEPR